MVATLKVWNVNGAEEKFFSIDLTRATGLQGVKTNLEVSKDLRSWGPASTDLELAVSRTNADGSVTDTFRMTAAVLKSGTSSLFFRVLVEVE